MSLAGLSKEQQKVAGLVALAVVVVVVLVVFGIRSSLSSIATDRVELEELTDNITLAEESLSRKGAFTKELGASTATLEEILLQLPPERNYYSWASERIYSIARAAGLDIAAIDETNMHAREDAGAGQNVQMEIYSLRITALGGYENTKQFLRGIERQHPLARFTGIEIGTGPKDDVHEVQIFIQWPFHMGSLARLWDEIDQKKKRVGAHAPPRNPAGERP